MPLSDAGSVSPCIEDEHSNRRTKHTSQSQPTHHGARQEPVFIFGLRLELVAKRQLARYVSYEALTEGSHIDGSSRVRYSRELAQENTSLNLDCGLKGLQSAL